MFSTLRMVAFIGILALNTDGFVPVANVPKRQTIETASMFTVESTEDSWLGWVSAL